MVSFSTLWLSVNLFPSTIVLILTFRFLFLFKQIMYFYLQSVVLFQKLTCNRSLVHESFIQFEVLLLVTADALCCYLQLTLLSPF